MPPVETWGDLQNPYGDGIEAEAAAALGPVPPGFQIDGLPAVHLAEFFVALGDVRDHRDHVARELLERAQTLRKMNGVDSLPPVRAALWIDPTCVPAYEEAAWIFLRRGAVGRAHALAVQGLRLESSSGRLWAALGEVYLRRGDDARARQALERALECGDSGGQQQIREALAVLCLRSGNPARADSMLGRRATSPALGSYIEGVQARQRGDLQAAREAFEAAARDPKAPTAVLVDLGNTEFALGHLEPADSAFQRALRQAPGETAALNGLAGVQRARGDLEGAVASFSSIVAQHPQNRAAQFNLAGTSLDAAQRLRSGPRADSMYATCERAFGACIESGFRADVARQRRAHLRLRRGDAAGAIEDARALLGDPAHAFEARLLLARAAMATKKPQDAVSVLKPGFDSDSLNVDALTVLGRAWLDLDRPADAARALRRAHERDPSEWTIAMNLGVALSRSGDLAAAESVLRALAASRPRDAEVLQNLAAVLQRRGRQAEADRLLREVEQLRSP